VRDPRAHLLITPERPALEERDLEVRPARDERPRRPGRKQTVLFQNLAVEPDPLEQVLLPAVVGDQDDVLHVLELDTFHAHLTGSPPGGAGWPAGMPRARRRSLGAPPGPTGVCRPAICRRPRAAR